MLQLRPFAALRYREYRLLSWGQLFGTMGLWMDEVSRGWLIYELTDSPLQLGLVRGVQAIVFLLLVPFAGGAADRYSRKAQLAISQGLNVIVYAALAFAIFAGKVAPWHVYATAVLVAVGQVFQQPARQSMLPDTVPREYLTNAIGLSAVMFNVARTLGPALAGILIVAAGTGGAFAAQSLLLALATASALLMRAAPPAGGGGTQREPFMRGILDGWRFSMQSEPVRAGLACTMLTHFLIVPFTTLLPVFARDLLEVGANGQGLLVSAIGVGALLSAALLATAGDRLPKGLLMMGASVAYGFVLVAFAASPWFYLSMAVMFAAGLCQVGTNALVQSVIQAHSPPRFRGRVMAIFSLNNVLMTTGGVVVSALAVAVGPRWAVAGMGIAGALSIIWLHFAMPGARRIR